jgi:hypothetical protein
MHLLTVFLPFVSLLPVILGAPLQLRPIETVKGDKKPNSYIITVKEGASSFVLAQKVKGEKTIFNPQFFNGFAGAYIEHGGSYSSN